MKPPATFTTGPVAVTIGGEVVGVVQGVQLPTPPPPPQPAQHWAVKCERCRNRLRFHGTRAELLAAMQAQGWRVVTVQTPGKAPDAFTYCPTHAEP